LYIYIKMTQSPLEIVQIFFGFLFAIGLIISVFAYKIKENEYGYGKQPNEPQPSPDAWTLQVASGSPIIANNNVVHLLVQGDVVNTVQTYDLTTTGTSVLLSFDIDYLFENYTVSSTLQIGFLNTGAGSGNANNHSFTFNRVNRFAINYGAVDGTFGPNSLSLDTYQKFQVLLSKTQMKYYIGTKGSSGLGQLIATGTNNDSAKGYVYKVVFNNVTQGVNMDSQFSNIFVDTNPTNPLLGLYLDSSGVTSDFDVRGYSRVLVLGVVLMFISILGTLRRIGYI